MTIDDSAREQLVNAAREAMARAYCPYSQFQVGAAILTDQGRIITGCNVENVSFGLTICAERTAATRAVAEGAGRPVAIAVAGNTETPLTPCGACRQFLAEFNMDLVVFCTGADGSMWQTSIRELLPGGFSPADLESGAGLPKPL